MATRPTEMDIPAPLLNKLALVRRRKMRVGIGVAALAALAVLLLAMVGAMFIDWTFTLFEPTWRVLLLLAAVCAAVATLVLGTTWTLRRTRTLSAIAADVDREVPDLEERWSTVAGISERQQTDPRNIHPVMMSHVTDEALTWAPQVNPQSVVSWQKIREPLAVLAGVGVVLFGSMLIDWRQTTVLMGRFWSPSSKISMTAIDGLDDVVVARGEELSINAELNGRTVDEATIFLRPRDRDEERQLLFPRGDSPQSVRYRQRVANDSFDYRIRAGDGQSDWYGVIVADRPKLSAVTVRIAHPEYTRREDIELRKLPEKLTAVEGSVFNIAFRTEEAVRSLQLRFGDENIKDLEADQDGWYRWQTTLDESFVLSPILTEPNGLQNIQPPVCRIDVLADHAPEVKIITPNDSIAVRPNDTIDIEFEAKDDFGISHAELIVYDDSNETGEPLEIMSIDIPLDTADSPKDVRGNVQLDLSKLDLKDGESISYAVRVHDTREMSSEDSPSSRMASTSDVAQDAGSEMTNDRSASGSLANASEGDIRNANQPTSDSNEMNQSDENPASSNANSLADKNTASGQNPTDSNEPSNSDAATSPQDQSSSAVASASQEPSDGSQGQPSPDSQPSANSQASAQPSSSNSQSPSGQSPSSQSPSSRSPSSRSSSSGSSQSPSQSAMASSENEPSQSSSSQTNRPSDEMTRRSLDVGNSQAGSSDRMSLTIDRWAGSFEGQSREKIELAIAPVIEELDRQLAQAEEGSRKLLDDLGVGTPWEKPQAAQLQTADDSLEKANGLIEDLLVKTNETPYAFVGLTLVDIGHSQITPAREAFWDAKQADDPERTEQIRTGWQHVQRARQLLAALNKQYEKVRRDFQLAESVERIKNMYQVYIENAHALLGSGGTDDLGGLQRKMAEFELDEEYLARLKEVLEMRQELMAEFARMLSDDPRLLRRYMDRLRARTKTLRYELAELTDRQKALAREVRAHETVEDSQRASLQKTILKQKLMEFEKISTAAAEMDERFRIWLPLDIEIKDGSLAESRDLTSQVAASSRELLTTAAAFGTQKTADIKPIAQQAEALIRKLGSLDAALHRVSLEDDRQDLADHQAKRLVETERIMSQTDGWLRKITELAKGNYHLTAEVDQHQLSNDTVLLAGKLSDIEAQLAGGLQTDSGSLPEPIAKLAEELMATLDEEVATNQLSAVYALRENQMPAAISRQGEAVTAMEKAEKQLQELLTMAIKEMDKLPVQDPLASALEDPTLDELLAALEQELESADDLGIPPRPNNLNVIGDMTMPGQGSSGSSGQGMMGSAMQLGAANEQLQKMLQKAYQEALGRALKEKRITRTAAAKHLRRLPDRGAKRWLVGSKLGDDLLQGSGKMAPEQYRQAIEQYFEQISDLRDTEESK